MKKKKKELSTYFEWINVQLSQTIQKIIKYGVTFKTMIYPYYFGYFI